MDRALMSPRQRREFELQRQATLRTELGQRDAASTVADMLAESQMNRVRSRVLEERQRSDWRVEQAARKPSEKEPWQQMDVRSLTEYIQDQQVHELSLILTMTALTEKEQALTIAEKKEASQHIAASLASSSSSYPALAGPRGGSRGGGDGGRGGGEGGGRGAGGGGGIGREGEALTKR